ncbi:type-F conjugative transfer system pilin acetylase TraX [Yersinia aleksiciae]|uniref:type-F conjugative transfer system pilin acetylase TraX n=1 Tax=Yersinia aleksiciae TaxID=263819 RepID=UPI0005DB2C2F|nr:type-F conjugative transfer system pilin acetylase TraX [Yersinia aleksiciae]CNI64750.1 conjugative transfer fimbrial acetylation protein [Yersinia frederiksenii]
MKMFEPDLQARQGVKVFLRFTPLQIDIIKIIALVMMVADHANRILGLNDRILLLLGRGAFPLFGLIWAYNLARHPLVTRGQTISLWLWALIAQPAYAFALRDAGVHWDEGNILFVFAVTTQIIRWCQLPQEKGQPNWKGVAFALAFCWTGLFAQSSYGIPGILMLGASYLLFADVSAKARGQAMLLWPFMVVLLNVSLGSVAMLAGLALSLFVLLTSLPLYQPHAPYSQTRLLPRNFFTQVYVIHLLALALIAWFFH